MKVVWCKKKWHKIPTDFAHYENEFNFEIQDDEEPVFYPKRLSDAASQSSVTQGS